MDEQQENLTGRVILFGGSVIALACLFLRLPNVLLWGVIAPLSLIALGWLLGRKQTQHPTSLLFPLILGIGLVGVNGWLLVQQMGFQLPARSTSTIHIPEAPTNQASHNPVEEPIKRYRHNFSEGDNGLNGWQVTQLWQ